MVSVGNEFIKLSAFNIAFLYYSNLMRAGNGEGLGGLGLARIS